MMRHWGIGRSLLGAVVFGWMAFGCWHGARAQTLEQRATTYVDQSRKQLQQVDSDIITITEELPKEDAKKPVSGPPSKSKMIVDEARERLEWLKATRDNLKEDLHRAEHARNPAEAFVYAKEARLKADSAANLTQSIIGRPAPAQPARSGAAGVTGATSSTTGLSASTGHFQFTSGALEQLKLSNRLSQEAAHAKSPTEAKILATEAFGDGRAGAGGVALWRAATLLTPLDRAKMTRASVEKGRLVLHYDGRKLRFPPFDRQFLAIAIRSVYEGLGLVHGKLLANESNAVVLSTGKGQYGDVVWKKEFLPDLPANLVPGQKVALDLGPGVGLLSLPKPSTDRVTYYGPIRGNVLGQVVQQSDMVFAMFWYGLNSATGKPLDVSKHPGFVSEIDRELKQTPAKEPRIKLPKAKNWWDDIVWFVWTPSEISIRLVPGKGEFEFVKAGMKVTVWSVREQNVTASFLSQGRYLTEHFDDYVRAFPILGRLKEAAKVVAVVRWLKRNGVPMNTGWADHYRLAKVHTPNEVRSYSVYIQRNAKGGPLVEAAR